MKILLRLLFLMGVVEAGQILLPAAETALKPPPVRCLFLIDTSHALGEHKSDIVDAVAGRLKTGLDGQLRAGDVFVIRTFGETGSWGADLKGVWNPHSKQTLPQALAGALGETVFKGRARVDLALTSAADFVTRAEELFVVVVTDAATPFKGTPFDAHINGVCRTIAAQVRAGSSPVLVTLLADGGRMLAWSVEPLPSLAAPTRPDTSAPKASPVVAAPPVVPRQARSPAPGEIALKATPAQTPSPKPQFSANPKPALGPRPEARDVGEASNPTGSTSRRGELPELQAGLADPQPAGSRVPSAPPGIVPSPIPGPSIISLEPAPLDQTESLIVEDGLKAFPVSENAVDSAALAIPNVPSPLAALENAAVLAKPWEAGEQAENSNAALAIRSQSAPALPVREVLLPSKADAADATTSNSAPEASSDHSLAFLALGSSLIAAAGAGLWCFARRRKPEPAQSLISRSIGAAK